MTTNKSAFYHTAKHDMADAVKLAEWASEKILLDMLNDDARMLVEAIRTDHSPRVYRSYIRKSFYALQIIRNRLVLKDKKFFS